jgi:ribonuclease HI
LSNSEFKEWLSQQHSNILFFDGASRNNLGVIGVGGIICDLGGNPLVQFSWGLGNVTNNSAEAYALWQGIRLAKAYGFRKIIILGDSMIMIRVLINQSDPDSKALLLTIKITTMNSTRKVLLKPYYLNYANNIILVGGTPL